MPKIILKFLLTLLISWSFSSYASFEKTIDDILARGEAPGGVVFEIVSGDADYLEQALPAIRKQSNRLRNKFKDLPIAVVTHGNEQFALTSARTEQHATVHQQVKILSLKENIPVHVCGTYAGMRGVSEEDFPKYVDVAPAGPAQIRNYMDLGYLRVRVKLD